MPRGVKERKRIFYNNLVVVLSSVYCISVSTSVAMEFEERKFMALSPRNALYQQVQEQSDLCDVTVQVGEWRKDFHWCVLVTSPFFECLRGSNFIEGESGIVKLNVSSALATESALLFLYGKKPKLTEENISALLEMSEFLIIPNLKSACVQYLKKKPITEENIMIYLQLASLYDFELSKCYDYIESHLTQVLQNREALYMTKDSVIKLFTNQVLMYVSAINRFEFIVRWADICQQNANDFPEVFNSVDLDGIDIEAVDPEIVTHPIIVQNNCVDKLQALEHISSHRVLIFANAMVKNSFACFSLESHKWYGLQIELPHDQDGQDEFSVFNTYDNKSIHSIKDSNLSVIYRVKDNYNKTYVCEQDINSNEAKVCTVSEDNCSHFDSYYINGDIFTAVNNKIHQRNSDGHSLPIDTVLAFARLTGESIYHQIAFKHMLQNQGRKSEIETSTLFQGTLQYPDTVLQPIITVLNTRIDLCCFNSNSHLTALISREKERVYIYDHVQCNLHAVNLKDDADKHVPSYNRYTMVIRPFDDGFVLYNKQLIKVISRQSGPSLTQHFIVQNAQLEYDRSWRTIKYFFCDRTWYRFLKESWDSDLTFEQMSHDTLMRKHSNKDISQWERLPVQDGVNQVTDSNAAFMVQLPKSMLTCHVKCPHCENQKEQSTRYISRDIVYGDSDDSSTAFDDSDDDVYAPSYYDDYYGEYYYSSD